LELLKAYVVSFLDRIDSLISLCFNEMV
jgi:hypothetical protein